MNILERGTNKGLAVAELRSALKKGTGSIQLIVDYLKLIIKHDIWREYAMHNHPEKVFKFDNFNDFITTEYGAGGLGTDKGKLLKICEDDQGLQNDIKRLTDNLNKNGIKNNPKNVGNRFSENNRTFNNVKRSMNNNVGNKSEYARSRLKRDHPELYEKVLGGELSANAAAIKAGFRKKTMTITADIDGIKKAMKKLGIAKEDL